MGKDSFKDQFPDYELIQPTRMAKLRPVFYWAFGIFLTIALPGYFLYQLGSMKIPTPNMAAVSPLTLNTMMAQAMLQSQKGQHLDAALNFKKYFALGGDNRAAMTEYARILELLGDTTSARWWAEKAKQEQK